MRAGEEIALYPIRKRLVAIMSRTRVVSYFEHTDKLHRYRLFPEAVDTLLLPEEDRNYITKSKLLDDVVVLMGGRVAESLVLNEISTGAQNDLQRATDIVRRMITEYGMSEELGPLTFGRRHEEVFLGRDLGHDRNYSEAIAFAIDKEARAFVETAYNRAKEILETHIDKLHQVANRLMEVEIMDGEEFRAIMEGENSKGES